MPTLAQSLQEASSKLPDSIRIRWIGQKRILFEEEPNRRLVSVSDQLFHLPLPWMVYTASIVRTGEGWMPDYWRIRSIHGRLNPLVENDGSLFLLPLPNLYGSRPCYYEGAGYSWDHHSQSRTIPASITDDYIQGLNGALAQWWMGTTNMDAFPWRDPVFKHLMRQPPTQQVTEPRGSNVRASNALARTLGLEFFSRWEAVTEKDLHALPWRDTIVTVASLLHTGSQPPLLDP